MSSPRCPLISPQFLSLWSIYKRKLSVFSSTFTYIPTPLTGIDIRDSFSKISAYCRVPFIIRSRVEQCRLCGWGYYLADKKKKTTRSEMSPLSFALISKYLSLFKWCLSKTEFLYFSYFCFYVDRDRFKKIG